MKRAHLGVQALIVLAMVAFVSWPQFRHIRVQSVWRHAPSAAQQARTDDAARYSDTGVLRRTSVLPGLPRFTTNLPEPRIGGTGGVNGLQADGTFYTPQAVAILGGKLNALVGMARNSLNAPIPYAKVLLRTILTGQVRARATANAQGEFSFLDLDNSLYVVELLDADGSVIASSQLMSLSRGDVRLTEVRAAAAAKIVAASFGNSLNATMAQVTTIATNDDVTRTTPALLAEESSR
jgi:hypothetical protein